MFSKCNLVDSIYPSLSCFILSDSDPHTNIAYSFAADQEALRKDAERGFGVLKDKFLALTHLINLHHCNNIYYLINYLVLGDILQHNMIEESRLENVEEVSSGMYYTSQLTAEDCGNVDHEDNLSDEDSDKDMKAEASMLWQVKFEFAYKRWSACMT